MSDSDTVAPVTSGSSTLFDSFYVNGYRCITQIASGSTNTQKCFTEELSRIAILQPNILGMASFGRTDLLGDTCFVIAV